MRESCPFPVFGYNSQMMEKESVSLSPKRVLLGLSGGVDSTAAAAILKAEGLGVTAVTLDTWQEGEGDSQQLERAARSARLLGLPHIIRDVKDLFYEHVVSSFVQDWQRGLSPNPCVMCNPDFKFKLMFDLADELGCDYVATGHYARILRDHEGSWLYRAAHRPQDQSYFLYRLPQPWLERMRFPLGEKTKAEARRIAAENSDPVSGQKDSQDICFLREGKLNDFLMRQGLREEEGLFVNKTGEKIGTHQGSWRYTVGQRRHLGQSFGRRMTVLSVDHEKNIVTLGDEDDARMTELELVDFVSHHPLPSVFSAAAQLRSQGKPLLCHVSLASEGRKATVRLDEPTRLTSPGQSLVLYDGERVLGGGIVARMTPLKTD